MRGSLPAMSRLLALLPEVVLALTGLLVFAALLAGDGRMRYARGAARAGRRPAGGRLPGLVRAPGREIFWSTYRVDALLPAGEARRRRGIPPVGVHRAATARGSATTRAASSSSSCSPRPAGLMVMASAVEALALYLALEIASFSLFVLVPLRERLPRRQGERAQVPGRGPRRVGGHALGLSLLIGLTGTTQPRRVMAASPAILARDPVAMFGLGALPARASSSSWRSSRSTSGRPTCTRARATAWRRSSPPPRRSRRVALLGRLLA